VSRERFGKEVEGMLKKSLPTALRLLHDMQVLPLLLTQDPAATAAAAGAEAAAAAAGAAGHNSSDAAAAAAVSSSGPSAEAWASMLEASAWLEVAIDRVPFFNEAGAEANGASASGAPAVAPASVLAQRRRTALLASAVLPFEGQPAAHGKKKALPAAQAALQEGLKTTLKDAEQSAAAVAAAPRLRELACRLGSGSPSASREGSRGGVSNGVPGAGGGDEALRLEVGLLLTSLKALWRPALAVALAVELHATLGPCPPRPPPDGADARDSWPAEAAAVAAQFEAVAATVARLGLDGCWATKPLLNGKELGTLLNLSPGPQIGDAMRHQALWQLEHPTGTKAGCLAALQARAST
jgi:hypothetical protein